MNQKPKSQHTETIGTVEVPNELRRAFLAVPTILWWVTIISIAALIPLTVMWADKITENSACRYSSRGCASSALIVAFFGLIIPFVVGLVMCRLFMIRKARYMAHSIADQLALDDEFRISMTKRFSYGWSIFGRSVIKSNQRFRLGSFNPSKEYTWIVSVTKNLSHLTVEKAPMGYLMPNDSVPM